MDESRYRNLSYDSLERSSSIWLDFEEECLEEEYSQSLCSWREPKNSLDWVVYNEAYCFDLERFTKKYIDALLKRVVEDLYPSQELVKTKDIVKPLVDGMISSPSADYELETVKTKSELFNWPKISEFNIKLGLEKVQKYVSAWKQSPAWLYCVEFLGWETEDCSNIFIYEVEWSKPTNAYPVPQTTASVYFALEVFNMVPRCFDRQVGVSYVFEASTVIHTPGSINFQEQWLEDILRAKLKFFKSIAFLGVKKQ